MNSALIWDNQPIKLKLSQRKSIALHVVKGEIELRAPYGVDMAFAKSFVESKDSWLRKTLAKQALLRTDKIDYNLTNHLPFMGLNLKVNRQRQRGRPEWHFDDTGLRLYAEDFDQTDVSVGLFESFLKAQARFWLTRKTLEAAEQASLRDKLTDIRFRRTKSKWGHCTSGGRIQYNWQIMMAPEPVIDYLVSHEVSHLKYLDHSAKFWATVATLHPNYQQDRNWLRQNEHRLQLE